MVLLYLLKRDAEKYGYFVSAVNFEHGIRGEESVADSLFVQDTCKAWGVLLSSFVENCVERAKREKLSLETAARNFRRENYEKILKDGLADFIATAHHANDNAETVLFRLARGTSLSGVIGIRKTDGKYIRPLIEKTKEEILAFANESGIPFREDSTNFEPIATRNIIRLDILPKIEEIVPCATKNLSHFASIASEDDEFLYELADSLITLSNGCGTVVFNVKKPVFRRAYLSDLYALQFLKMGAKISLPNNLEAKKTKDGIFFYKKEDFCVVDFEPKRFECGEFLFGKYQVYVTNEPLKIETGEKVLRLDGDKIPKDCIFRQRLEGDVFRKYGGGTKSLKRYLIDKKIPVENRDMPLLTDANGSTVYAVCGVEIADDVKVTDQTKKTVYIAVKNIGEKKNETNDASRRGQIDVDARRNCGKGESDCGEIGQII